MKMELVIFAKGKMDRGDRVLRSTLKNFSLYVVALLIAGCGGSGGGDSSSKNEQESQPVTVQAPKNLQADFGDGELSLTWDEVSGADSYNIYYANEPGIRTENYSSYDGGTWLRDVSSPLTITQLRNGVGYFAIVTAVRSGKESSSSGEVSALVRDPDAVIAGRYKPVNIRGDVILDTVNALYWKRCSVGQEWNLKDQTCTGIPQEMNWYDAVENYGTWADIESLPAEYVVDLKLPLPSGEWRLPTIDQLATLLYCSTERPQKFGPLNYCEGRDYQKPTIVLEAFPDAPLYDVWSGSVGGEIGSGLDLDAAWRAHFWSGGYTYNSRSGSMNAIRLVHPQE
ncbi:DUF1566 domain-containing protein [Marinobacter sp. SS8-8]|uniref:Lcl C-terminal domain-containing protein n=1 Tax=Marinobacter sp. SS8-8 TaxID=3050452 RepID=UPI0026E01A37|nr:DUF1566 domain-containing protein [Marinobacter sp. SS8-8]